MLSKTSVFLSQFQSLKIPPPSFLSNCKAAHSNVEARWSFKPTAMQIDTWESLQVTSSEKKKKGVKHSWIQHWLKSLHMKYLQT